MSTVTWQRLDRGREVYNTVESIVMHSIKGSAFCSQAIKTPVARQNGTSRDVIHWLYPDPSQDKERCRTVVITAQVGDYKGLMLRSKGESVSGFN